MRRLGAVLALALAVLRFASALPQGGGVEAVTGWTVRDSEPRPGAFADSVGTEGFAPYDGGYLVSSAGPGPRMFTFRAEIALEKAPEGKSLAIFLGPGDYPRDLYWNGVQLFKSGDHGERYNSTVYYSSRILVPAALVKGGGQPNLLVIEAFPAFERSPLGDVSIGDFYEVTRMVFLRDLFGVHLIRAAAVAALIIGLFFLFLFLFSGRKDIEYLWFAFACFAFALGYSNMSLYHDGSDDVLLDKLSRIGMPLTILFLAYFTMRFTGLGERRRWLKPLLALPVLASIAITVTLKDKEAVSTFFGGFTTNFILTPGLLLILALLLWGALRTKAVSNVVVLLGFLAAVAASLHDISYLQRHVVPFAYLVAYGYLTLLVSIFFVLAIRQARLSRELELRTAGLDERNTALGEMVGELTAVSEGLVSSSGAFEATLGETIAFIEAYSRENRAIVEAFAEQTRAVDSVIDRIARRLAESSERVPLALETQTQAVERVSRTLSEMDDRIGENLRSAVESSSLAEELSRSADEGHQALALSKASIDRVDEYSGTLQGVLGSIEEIAERTHILSINAAIESARLGAQGRGFAVVAQEIRNLSSQSRTSLASSFEKIREMAEAISRTSELSSKVSLNLSEIVEKAKGSAGRTVQIRERLDQLRSRSGEIMSDAESLLSETRTISALSVEERALNEERSSQFQAMKETLASITRQLEAQDQRAHELGSTLDRMREAMDRNAGHIARLKSGIEKARLARH